jgi:hypothetical protein
MGRIYLRDGRQLILASINGLSGSVVWLNCLDVYSVDNANCAGGPCLNQQEVYINCVRIEITDKLKT